jgi:hypothetical protein
MSGETGIRRRLSVVITDIEVGLLVGFIRTRARSVVLMTVLLAGGFAALPYIDRRTPFGISATPLVRNRQSASSRSALCTVVRSLVWPVRRNYTVHEEIEFYLHGRDLRSRKTRSSVGTPPAAPTASFTVDLNQTVKSRPRPR